MDLYIDIESRSMVDLRKNSVTKYGTKAEVTVVSWAVDGGDIVVEDLTEFHPSRELIAAAQAADRLWAHNAEFDRTVLETTDWWPDVDWKKWRCTAATARMHGLPGGLDKLSSIFKLGDEGKDKRGKALIQLFCKPNKEGVYEEPVDHPDEWAEFLSYAGQDVTAMRALLKNLPVWNRTKAMWARWHLDQVINARGVAIDVDFCAGAIKATTKAKKLLADRTDELSMGLVDSTTQVQRMKKLFAAYGVDLPDLKADTVERRLNDENLPEFLKELLRIRQQASKSSTAKYKRAVDMHVGGRMYNLLVFCGAMRTGRFAGRYLQPQNFFRQAMKQWQINQGIEMFRRDAADLLDPDEVMKLAANCLRGMFIAKPGHNLVVADLANIEGRFMAWVAGEHWKIKAFEEFDNGSGPDLYKLAYARAFHISADSIGDDDPRRQIGKVMELALQYYGGVGAFVAMAETYRLDLDSLADAAWSAIPAATLKRAKENHAKAIKRKRIYGLSEKVWLVCESLVLLWRAAHPAITLFWRDIEDAAKSAIRTPDRTFKVGAHIQIDRKGSWLRFRLPSGRYLLYPTPSISMEGDTSFVGVNPYTRQWGRIKTYSGKWAENIVQAGAADILLDGLLAAEAAGFRPVLSVHDEIVCESPDSPEFTDLGLSQLMCNSSPWAAGLPLAAKGYTSKRYKK